MIRAIESRDLIIEQFPRDFFATGSIKMTDMIRESACVKPAIYGHRKVTTKNAYEI